MITTDISVTITPMAQETITNCHNLIHQVRAVYGPQEADRLAASFGLAFSRLVSMGGTISKDSEFGLLGTNFITVGMVFFPEDQEKSFRRWHEDWKIDEHDLAFINKQVRSGEWSLHS